MVSSDVFRFTLIHPCMIVSSFCFSSQARVAQLDLWHLLNRPDCLWAGRQYLVSELATYNYEDVSQLIP
jgi:hypothetical protein